MLDLSGEPLIVTISIFVGMAALVLTLLFLLLAVALRGLLGRREEYRRGVEARWMPVMLRSLREPDVEVPPLRRRDGPMVLAIWNRLVAGIEGEAVERLRSFAHRAGLTDVAHRMLRRAGQPDDQLVAVVFLGRQRDVRGVRSLLELAVETPLVVRAEAARALVRIDPEAGPRAVAPLVAIWDDCHPAVAVAILKDAPAYVAARAVADEALASDRSDRQARLVDVLASIKGRAGLDAARQILARGPDAEVVSRCLSVLREHRRPEDIGLVRSYLDHPAPFVRVQAVTALGRMQGPGDQWRLAARLDDRDWWVRVRAAQALVTSPRMPPVLTRMLADVHPDRYARGALRQVLSEQELAP